VFLGISNSQCSSSVTSSSMSGQTSEGAIGLGPIIIIILYTSRPIEICLIFAFNCHLASHIGVIRFDIYFVIV